MNILSVVITTDTEHSPNISVWFPFGYVLGKPLPNILGTLFFIL